MKTPSPVSATILSGNEVLRRCPDGLASLGVIHLDRAVDWVDGDIILLPMWSPRSGDRPVLSVDKAQDGPGFKRFWQGRSFGDAAIKSGLPGVKSVGVIPARSARVARVPGWENAWMIASAISSSAAEEALGSSWPFSDKAHQFFEWDTSGFNPSPFPAHCPAETLIGQGFNSLLRAYLWKKPGSSDWFSVDGLPQEALEFYQRKNIGMANATVFLPDLNAVSAEIQRFFNEMRENKSWAAQNYSDEYSRPREDELIQRAVFNQMQVLVGRLSPTNAIVPRSLSENVAREKFIANAFRCMYLAFGGRLFQRNDDETIGVALKELLDELKSQVADASPPPSPKAHKIR